ncbi:MAG: mannose-1-phosphate guanylyltransferase/mannose-6-phosphate isomerase [Pseudomonadota bacterium]
MIIPVILAGGSGTRLWPVSRKSYPKQFTPIVGQDSLFQQTVRRVSAADFASPTVITGADFRFITAEQLDSVHTDARIVIEPEPRGTAPAVLTAALLHEDTPDALLLICPSDHSIADDAAFLSAVRAAAFDAQDSGIVTFGVTPTRAETGYGYLETAPGAPGQRVVPLTRFVEKPDQDVADQMLQDPRYLWNAGLFMMKVSTALRAFEEHAPHLMGPCRGAVTLAQQDLDFTRLDAAAFAQAEDVAVDVAIMEKHSCLRAVPMDAGWSDMGSWTSVWTAQAQDADGNALSTNASALDCTGSLLRSDDPSIEVVGLGLDGIAAIATRDAVLVADMRNTERMREVVTMLKAKGAPQAESFQRCHRPWGYYETLSLGPRFQVKRICVHPGAQLSLQSHMHRAEHWVIVEGSANVTIGESVRLLSENQSTYIPLGEIHRLENPGKVPLHLIEVQSGAYLGEDDIIRYEDIYARVQTSDAA